MDDERLLRDRGIIVTKPEEKEMSDEASDVLQNALEMGRKKRMEDGVGSLVDARSLLPRCVEDYVGDGGSGLLWSYFVAGWMLGYGYEAGFESRVTKEVLLTDFSGEDNAPTP